MAVDYYQVIKDQKIKCAVIGRGELSARSFAKKTGFKPFVGGLNYFLKDKPNTCSHAIVAVGVEELLKTTKKLLKYGIKNILVEKPAGINKEEIEKLSKKTKKNNANVFVAYNRRFFTSVIKAREIIEKDGGVTSFNFEFTEWAHEVENIKNMHEVKKNWFLANSTHVVDLAFYLGGNPKEISCYTEGSLEWHPSASIFSGAGISETGALFSYQANWESAGRWCVDVLTKNNKLIFLPLEKLQVQQKGSVNIDLVKDIDYSLDKKYKPGIFLQVKAFLKTKKFGLLDIYEHARNCEIYERINGR